jgi:hypothetical protein
VGAAEFDQGCTRADRNVEVEPLMDKPGRIGLGMVHHLVELYSRTGRTTKAAISTSAMAAAKRIGRCQPSAARRKDG